MSRYIVTCRNCGKFEYWDFMTWKNGKTYCRSCIYDYWEQISDWKRSEIDLVYPDYMEEQK